MLPTAPPASFHLGTFDGERKQRAAGYDEPYSLPKALASLAAVTVIIFAASTILGAV